MCKFDPVDHAPSHYHGMWSPALPSVSVVFVVAASAPLLVFAAVFPFCGLFLGPDLSPSFFCCVEELFSGTVRDAMEC